MTRTSRLRRQWMGRGARTGRTATNGGPRVGSRWEERKAVTPHVAVGAWSAQPTCLKGHQAVLPAASRAIIMRCLT